MPWPLTLHTRVLSWVHTVRHPTELGSINLKNFHYKPADAGFFFHEKASMHTANTTCNHRLEPWIPALALRAIAGRSYTVPTAVAR